VGRPARRGVVVRGHGGSVAAAVVAHVLAVPGVGGRFRLGIPGRASPDHTAAFHDVVFGCAFAVAEIGGEKFRVLPDVFRRGVITVTRRRIEIVVVHQIQRLAAAELADGREALGAFSAFPRLVQRGQKHGGQNGDDGDDDEEFNEREMFLHGIILLS